MFGAWHSVLIAVVTSLVIVFTLGGTLLKLYLWRMFVRDESSPALEPAHTVEASLVS
jgi:hypothetical protein